MASAAPPTRDDFAKLLEQTLGDADGFEGRVVHGTVTGIENDMVVIDVGLKSEGRVPLREFAAPGQKADLKVGDEVEVFVDRVENSDGEAMLSRDRARREAAWDKLESEFGEGKRVEGRIFGRVKGGFNVDLDGAVDFLPGSQVDIRPVRDVGPQMDVPQPFQILKMDRRRGNIVVSRRAVREETRAEQRSELIDKLSEGQILDGVVKNITDYGAVVDLGGIDGLLHITDLAWRRVRHPSEVLSVGQEITAKVLKYDQEKTRVSLGVKQLGDDPWTGLSRRYPTGTRLFGKVTNQTDYGAFVEVEQGSEGLVHVSEMDWTNKNVAPNKVVQLGDEVEVMVLEIDEDRRRISLGMKQCKPNPWEDFAMSHKKGDKVSGAIKSITDFGVVIGLSGIIDGLVHLSDLSWTESGEEAVRKFKKGDELEAVVLAIDVERERVSLGVKQLEGDPFNNFATMQDMETLVSGAVKSVEPKGAVIQLSDEVEGYLRASEIARDRVEDAGTHLKVGDAIDAMIINIDRKARSIQLSIKAKDNADTQEAMQKMSTDASAASGTTSLGALQKAKLDNKS